MSRRVSLPGADELFRTTGGTALQPSSPAGGSHAPGSRVRRQQSGEPRVPAPAGESDPVDDGKEGDASHAQRPDGDGAPGAAEHGDGREADARKESASDRRPLSERGRPTARQQAEAAAQSAQPAAARRRSRAANRRPSGRERHDEKITVYVSAEELMDLEHARLVLRGEHGLAVDRGRIVREAVAVVLADLESRGDASILVRRLRGR
ncbi:hypothetical protein RKE29_27270 [Streptomyces sp. B1866]|uniref:hypothetical protein n=1 Tax=Streptomyces sp. B1866 TaxID=3075431 RepID=UPI0028914524|nr:hypothetical protein [Streptomyces sp. B1866]MDT3400271.1 hypothetical protein [Streptomyces sp. B1866]